MSEQPELSIIIPCRDDAQALQELLPQLTAQASVEVIVVSPVMDEELLDLCARAGVHALVSDRPRGARLKSAADSARAQWLWFVHADSRLEPGAADAVIEAFGAGAMGGYFRFRLAGPRTLAKRLIEFGVALRCRCGGIPYGDQAIFVTREAYEAAGGHEPLALFDEFRLLRRLKADADFHALTMTIGVNSARWDRNGYLKHVIKNRFMSIAYLMGVSPEKLARWYYE